MSYECLLYETKDRVATLTLNRPDRLNALGGTLREDLTAGLTRAIDDPDVRVIVITGAGKGFCAGGDVKAMQDANQAGRGRPLMERVAPSRDRTVLLMRDSPKPLIAAVNGAAAGAGMNLALALAQRGGRSPVVARVRDVRPEHLRRDRRRAGGDSRVRGEARADVLGPLSDYPRRPPAIIRKNAGDRRGSSVSRMPSPRRLNASTVTVMARPGKKASHHGGTSAVIESASMLPHVGVGGGTPTPRKPSAASMTSAAPRCVVARTR